MAHQKPKHGAYGGHHDHKSVSSGHSGGHMHAAQTTIHQKGMVHREPNAVDASTRTHGPTVDHEACRHKTAETPPTLGPRNA